jgi:hypothetical protein
MNNSLPPALVLTKLVYWAGGVAQVVKDLPSKSETLSSNPRTAKKKKKNQSLLNNQGDILLCFAGGESRV